jgi:SAM-dependent methyltransferase
MDAALLAAACDAQPGDRVLDLGCGPGAVMLAAAVRRPGAHFTGIEADPQALDLARANIDLNGLADRVEGLAGDVALPFSRLGLPRFDAADGRVAEVIAFPREARPVLVRVGSDIRELRLSARGGWSLTTVDGLEVELGRNDALPRLSRFARLLPTLGRDPAGRVLQRADLRYTNGFALTWAEPAAAPTAPPASSNA